LTGRKEGAPKTQWVGKKSEDDSGKTKTKKIRFMNGEGSKKRKGVRPPLVGIENIIGRKKDGGKFTGGKKGPDVEVAYRTYGALAG